MIVRKRSRRDFQSRPRLLLFILSGLRSGLKELNVELSQNPGIPGKVVSLHPGMFEAIFDNSGYAIPPKWINDYDSALDGASMAMAFKSLLYASTHRQCGCICWQGPPHSNRVRRLYEVDAEYHVAVANTKGTANPTDTFSKHLRQNTWFST